MTLIDELAPCPFCGGDAREFTGKTAIGMPFAYVMCDQCNISTITSTDIEAVRAQWNRRAATKAEGAQAPVAWHVEGCEGECIGCLIEQTVREQFGTAGVEYLHKHTAPQSLPDSAQAWRDAIQQYGEMYELGLRDDSINWIEQRANELARG